MEEYNIKWYVSILSTKFGEWSIPTKVRPSSINKWYKDIITTTVVTTFWSYQDPTTTQITVQEFIKYLLDTWKTKQFVRDHRIFITPNSQHIILFFDLWPECSHHLPVLGLLPPLTTGNKSLRTQTSWSRPGQLNTFPLQAQAMVRFEWGVLFHLQFPVTQKKEDSEVRGSCQKLVPMWKVEGQGGGGRGKEEKLIKRPTHLSSRGLLLAIPLTFSPNPLP